MESETAQRSVPAQRDDVGPLPPDETSSLITPFTVVPRWLSKSTGGQVFWNIVLFVALPTAAFAYWTVSTIQTGLPPEYEQMRFALPLAAVWVMTSPLLMYVGERTGAHWVASLAADASFGWNVERVRRWKRRIDITYYPTALLGAAAAVTALAVAQPTVRAVLPTPPGWGVPIVYLVWAQAGFTAMGGLHGVLRWIVVTRAAVNGVTLAWHPFRAPAHGSLRRSYQLSLMLGVFFSTGAFFVPTLLAVVDLLVPLAQIVVWSFIVLLLIGGILIFLVPMVTLLRALAEGKRRFVAGIEAPLGDLLDEMTVRQPLDGADQLRRAEAIERLMTIRSGVVAARLVPFGQTIGRGLLTVVIPVVSLVLSALQSGVLPA